MYHLFFFFSTTTTLFSGPTLINQENKIKSIDTILQKNNIVMLYFSASWCPPCKQFTPKLATFYKQMKEEGKGRSLEIIFISADRDVGSFQEYDPIIFFLLFFLYIFSPMDMERSKTKTFDTLFFFFFFFFLFFPQIFEK